MSDGEENDTQIIETGDSVKVKQVLDECVCTAVGKAGRVINYNIENLKLFFMFMACVFAMIAQFYPKPFPDNLTLLGVCCFCYFMLSSSVQFIVSFVETDKLVDTYPGEGQTHMVVRTAFPKYQEYYQVTIEDKGDSSAATKGKMYVGKYFTERGEFDEIGFMNDMAKLISKFEQKKYKEYEFSFKKTKAD